MNAVETLSSNGYQPNPAMIGARNNFRHMNPHRQRSQETSAQQYIEQQNDSINLGSKYEKPTLSPTNKLTVHPPMKAANYKRHMKDSVVAKEDKKPNSREVTPLNHRKVPSQQQTPNLRAGKNSEEADSIKLPSRDISRGRAKGDDQSQYSIQSKAKDKLQKIVNPKENLGIQAESQTYLDQKESIIASLKETSAKQDPTSQPDYFQSIYEEWNNSYVTNKEHSIQVDSKEKPGTIEQIYGTPSKILKSRDRTPKAESSISTLQHDSRRARSSQRDASLLRKRGEQNGKVKNFTIRKISSDRDDQYHTVQIGKTSSTDLSNTKSESHQITAKSHLVSNANSRNASTRKQRNETTIAIFDSDYNPDKSHIIPSTTDNISKPQLRHQSEERHASQTRKPKLSNSQLEPVQRNEKSLTRPDYRIKKDIGPAKIKVFDGSIQNNAEVENSQEQKQEDEQSNGRMGTTQESRPKLYGIAESLRHSEINQLNPLNSYARGSSQATDSIDRVAVLPTAEKKGGFKRKKYFSNQRTSNPESNSNHYPYYNSNLAHSEQPTRIQECDEDAPMLQSPKIRREESNKNLLNDLSDEHENPFEVSQEQKLDLKVVNTSSKMPFGDMMESSINSYLNEKDSITASKTHNKDSVVRSTNANSAFKRSRPEASGYKRKSTAANSNDLSFFSTSDHRESKINRAHLFESTENSNNNVEFNFNLEEEKESKELLKTFKGKIDEQLKEEKENEEDSIVNHGESESSLKDKEESIVNHGESELSSRGKEERKSEDQSQKSKGFLPPAFPFGDLPSYPFGMGGGNEEEEEESVPNRADVNDSFDNPVMFESSNFAPEKNTIDVSDSDFPRNCLKPKRGPSNNAMEQDNSPKADHLSHVKPLYFYANGQKHTNNAPFKTNINPKLALQKELEGEVK